MRLDEGDIASEIGERVPVGLDLEWETGDVVHGDVLVGRARIAVDAWGRFVEGHALTDEPVAGAVVARVEVPGLLERTLVRTPDGLRWAQRATTG